MKKQLIVLLVLSVISLGNAQTTADQLLNEVSAKLKGYSNIAIDFKYVLNNTEENISQETRGDVILEGEKYKLNILGVTRIYDGTTLYNISPEDEEITVTTGTQDDENTITPSKMLTFYENGYVKAMDIIQNINGRKIQYVKLTPIDSNTEIKEVLLGIDSKTKHIYNLIEIGKSGTKTTLTVNSFKTDEPISKTLFTFDKNKYANYYINNLD